MTSLVGIAATGTTPYVIGGLEACNKIIIITGDISCNAEKSASSGSDVLLTLSFERNGEALEESRFCPQKLVLNMISTASMIN
jgi:N-acetylmuramic acid 6-phosphate etherase